MTPFFKPVLAFLAAMLIGCLVLVAAGRADGTTLVVDQSPCSWTSFCYDVKVEGNPDILVAYSKPYGRLTILAGEKTWDSGIYALLGAGDTLVSVPLYDGQGNVTYATLTFTGGETIYPCHQNGRVCVFSHKPRYVSGTLLDAPGKFY